LNCSGFKDKLEVVYRTVPPKKNFTKPYYNNGKIKLIFVSSGNFEGEFWIKGGLEALETFLILNKKYPRKLEFVIRSDVPRAIYQKIKSVQNIKVINKIIPWQELEKEFISADILLLPAHHTPSLTFLDAMSYELPVITIDSWANSEIVENGKTGFVIEHPKERWLPVADFLPWGEAKPIKRIKVDFELVKKLVEKTSILIEDEELRKRMGKAGRWEVEHGRFSIERRNQKLKRIFDEATS
jgi:glycosyltransferase involved in cell wall biosynthesis